MPLIDIEKGNFQTTIGKDGIVLIDVWASYCGACKEFAPIFEAVAEGNPDHVFAKLDAVAQNELVRELGVANIPSLLLYREGILLFNQPGYYDREKLQDIVEQAAALDMAMVRADMEATQAGSEGTDENSQ